MTNSKPPVEGVIPAVITPLNDDGRLDGKLLSKQMGYLRDAGVHGLFLGGTTAEGAYLSRGERNEAVRLAKEIGGGRLTLYGVVLRPHTEQVVEEVEELMEAEPDYIAAVTPYYHAVSQETIYHHFERIADASDVPLILYNIPQNTHNVLEMDTVGRLAEHPNIAGIKDSSGNFVSFLQGMLSGVESEFAWVQGDDSLDAASLLCGASALVTGLGNVWIEPYVRMYQAALAGNVESVKEEQRKVYSLMRIISVADGAGIPAIKTALAVLGRSSPRMRSLGETLSPKIRRCIQHVLTDIGLP